MTRDATRNRANPLPAVFWRQWSASAVSNLGDGITFVAMPLLAFSLTADERLLSLTAFAALLPWLVLALPIGVIVDRVDRRLLMAGASVLRTAIFAVVALSAATGWISIWVLLGALTVIGTCEVLFDSTAQAFLPSLVDGADLPRTNGYLMAAEIVLGGVVGLSVGAFLFAADTSLPFVVNAAFFAGAAGLIVSIRRSDTKDADGAADGDGGGGGGGDIAPDRVHMRHDIVQGLRWLWSDPLLRTLALLLAVVNFGLMLGAGIFVKYAAVELGVDNTGYWLLLLVSAVGATVGGLTGHRIQRRIGTALGIVVPYLVFALSQLMFALVPIAWVIGATGFAVSFAITTWNVVTVSLRQVLIPRVRFGRVNSVYRWLGTGASSVGALVGGQIAYYTNMRMTYLVAGVITLVALALGGRRMVAEVRDRAPSDQALEPATPAPPSMT